MNDNQRNNNQHNNLYIRINHDTQHKRHSIVGRFPNKTTCFMSADVYCQILNNRQYAEWSYLYSSVKKGKQARCRRDRERVLARQSLAENRVGVHCKNGSWGAINYFRMILGS